MNAVRGRFRYPSGVVRVTEKLPVGARRCDFEAAVSIDIPPVLLAHVGALFGGLDALGSSPRRVVNMLARAGITEAHRVADLGCGKGAVGVETAARLRCRVLGVDAIPEFIDSARALAKARGVTDRCRLVVGDQARVKGRFDGALSIGVMPLEGAAALCRARVKRGGVYILDDVVRLERVGSARGLGAPTLREARELLERDGDAVEACEPIRPAQVRALNARTLRRLTRNGARLADDHPRLRRALAAFLERQRDAVRVLTGPLRPTLWLVRRGH
jgi:SAM-dependent methyltransferase